MTESPLWLPSSNLAKLHAVPPMAKVFAVPVHRTGGSRPVVKALCGREIEPGVARVLGQSPPRCRHCLKRIGEEQA